MKLRVVILFLIATTTAMPPPEADNRAEALIGSTSEWKPRKCDTSRNFCFDEVVFGKGTDV